MSTPTVGQTIMAGPLATTFLVTGDMVGGAYCVVRQTVRVGQLFWPHIHVNEDQVIIVLSGRLGVRVGDREWTVGAGESAYRPKGQPHTVWNVGPDDVDMIEITSPGAFDQYFAALAEITAAGDDAARSALLAKYQVAPVPGWDKELGDRHGVRQ
jgi:mannose-6-phosphate isomerase-like protein (cupin superfamily)